MFFRDFRATRTFAFAVLAALASCREPTEIMLEITTDVPCDLSDSDGTLYAVHD